MPEKLILQMGDINYFFKKKWIPWQQVQQLHFKLLNNQTKYLAGHSSLKEGCKWETKNNKDEQLRPLSHWLTH